MSLMSESQLKKIVRQILKMPRDKIIKKNCNLSLSAKQYDVFQDVCRHMGTNVSAVLDDMIRLLLEEFERRK